MADIWSPEELAEADDIYSRVRPLLRPDAQPFFDRTRARFNGEQDEREARGAWFELRMLGRLADQDLRELELERCVAPGRTDCSVDLYLAGKGVGVELMAAQQVIVPPVQVPEECSVQYLVEEHRAAFRFSLDFAQDQAERLFRAVDRKCKEKLFGLLGFPTWLLVNTDDTDWLEHFRTNLTREEHFLQLGEAFRSMAGAPGTKERPNHLRACNNVGVGFVNSFHGAAPEHLVVFGRNEFERTGSGVLAETFGLVRL